MVGKRRVPIGILDLHAAIRGDVFADKGTASKMELGRWKALTLKWLAEAWWVEFLNCCIVLSHLPREFDDVEEDFSDSDDEWDPNAAVARFRERSLSRDWVASSPGRPSLHKRASGTG